MRQRRGGSVLEIALFVPILFTLLVGMVQVGKITYVYYTLRKTLYTMGRFVAAQQGVNFCDDADAAVLAAKNFALSGNSSDDSTSTLLPSLTADLITISAERYDPESGVPVACDCSVAGCDTANGGGSPNFVVVSIPNGYEVNPRIPFLTLDPILLRPLVRVPYWRHVMLRRLKRCESGQTAVEYGILYAGVIVPLTFAIIFVAEMLWVWHSVVDYTRDGAAYAATHCWTANGDNVRTYMQTHVPRMIDMDQFQQGQAQIAIEYFSRDPDTGSLIEFTCDGDCSVDCIPDAVTVRIQTYEFRRFVNFLGLPPVVIPDFRASLPMESAGCDAEQGTCLP